MEYVNSMKKRIKKEVEYTRKGLAGFSAPGNAVYSLPASIISAFGGCLTGGCAYAILYAMDKVSSSITGAETTNPLIPATLIGALTSLTLFLTCARSFGKYLSERAPKA